MTDSDPTLQAVAATVEAAGDQLKAVDPSPFSPQGFTVLKEKVAEYVGALVSESVKMMKRHDADTVSPTYVEDANRYLMSSAGRRWVRHLGTVGGILLGAALSNLLSMTTAERYSTLAVLVTVAFAIGGTFMVALHISKE